MPIQRAQFNELLHRGGRISVADVRQLVTSAKTEAERAELLRLALEHKDAFSPAAMAELEKARPPDLTGAATSPGAEIAQMIKDGVIDVTAAIGFDEGGADRAISRNFRDGLKQRGFESFDAQKVSDDDLRAMGLDPSTIDKGATYFHKKAQIAGKDVHVFIRYVDRETPQPAKNFGAGFRESDLVVYSGHARYGSGPDFDTKESAAENFVIGTPYDSHMAEILRGKKNELTQGKLTDDYQMMFFSACNSINYRDELRTLLKNKNAENLDLLVSTEDLPWSTSDDDLFTALDWVLKGTTVEELQEAVAAVNGSAFTFDGVA